MSQVPPFGRVGLAEKSQAGEELLVGTNEPCKQVQLLSVRLRSETWLVLWTVACSAPGHAEAAATWEQGPGREIAPRK